MYWWNLERISNRKLKRHLCVILCEVNKFVHRTTFVKIELLLRHILCGRFTNTNRINIPSSFVSSKVALCSVSWWQAVVKMAWRFWSIHRLLKCIRTALYGRDSSVGIATTLGAGRFGDQITVEARFSAPVQTGPLAHSASYTRGPGSFSGVKWPGRGVDHPLPSGTEVEKRVELYLYSPSGPSWPVVRWTLPLRLVRCTIHIFFFFSLCLPRLPPPSPSQFMAERWLRDYVPVCIYNSAEIHPKVGETSYKNMKTRALDCSVGVRRRSWVVRCKSASWCRRT
jgi:hypothetical protein